MSFVKVTSAEDAGDWAPTPTDATRPRAPATAPHIERKSFRDARWVAFIEHAPALTRDWCLRPARVSQSRGRPVRTIHGFNGPRETASVEPRAYRLALLAWTTWGLASPGRRICCRAVGRFASRNGGTCTTLPVSADS